MTSSITMSAVFVKLLLNWNYIIIIIIQNKMTYFCQTPVSGLGLGVDFLFPLSQQEEEPSPKSQLLVIRF